METILIMLLCYVFCAAISIGFTKLMGSPKENGRPRLPPGSMGLPYIGETLLMFSQTPHKFFFSRFRRNGEIFKTHLLGCPSIVLASPDAIKFVLTTSPNLFKPTYPPCKEKLLGPAALFFHQNDYHSQVRKLVVASLLPNVIRHFIPDIEVLAKTLLDSLSSVDVVPSTFRELKNFTFDVAVLNIFGNLESHYKEILKKNYAILDRGYNSTFFTKIPGSLYKQSVSARKRLGQILKEIIGVRKEIKSQEIGLLTALLTFRDEFGQGLTDIQIADNIIGVLFAAQDTTASLLTWILKYLHDDPNLLQAIKKEQKTIYRANGAGRQPLTWDQIKNMMPLTNKVILESLRMATIISFTYREAVEDVVYKGFLIPKGWKVLPLFRVVHHSPEYFTDPHLLKPSRFEVAARPNTFMPFGNGVHRCPGDEAAKLEVLILIHHLVNNFSWELVGNSEGVVYDPFPIPDKGLPAKFRRA
ncbi:hypothetical protein ACFE04_021901 [Oxalis oulophora]